MGPPGPGNEDQAQMAKRKDYIAKQQRCAECTAMLASSRQLHSCSCQQCCEQCCEGEFGCRAHPVHSELCLLWRLSSWSCISAGGSCSCGTAPSARPPRAAASTGSRAPSPSSCGATSSPAQRRTAAIRGEPVLKFVDTVLLNMGVCHGQMAALTTMRPETNSSGADVGCIGFVRCVASRELLKHHQKCNSSSCPVCTPVKQYVQKQRANINARLVRFLGSAPLDHEPSGSGHCKMHSEGACAGLAACCCWVWLCQQAI